MGEAIVTSEGDVDLTVLGGILRRQIWLVLTGAIVFSALGIAYAAFAPKWYRAEVAVVQVESRSMPGSLGQLGGLASLAGINLDMGSNSKVPMAVLQSREFVQQFIVDENLSETLRKGSSNFLFGRWFDQPSKWDVRDATRFFIDDVREFEEDRRSGVVTLRVNWIEPEAAARWANLLIDRANEHLRQEALQEAERNIKYLQSELAGTNIPALQQSLSKILEGEMQKFLLARGNREFAFKIVDRASVPKKKLRPKRALFGAGGAFLGALLGAILALFVDRRRAQRR